MKYVGNRRRRRERERERERRRERGRERERKRERARVCVWEKKKKKKEKKHVPAAFVTTKGFPSTAGLPAGTSTVYVDFAVPVSVETRVRTLPPHASVTPSALSIFGPRAPVVAHPEPLWTCPPQFPAVHARVESASTTSESVLPFV